MARYPAHVRLSVPNLTQDQALNAWNYVLHLTAVGQPITPDVVQLAAAKAAANVQLVPDPEQVHASADRPDQYDRVYDHFGIPRPPRTV